MTLFCVQQNQWLDIICSQQDGSYDVELMREEQEILDYSYCELVIHSFVKLTIVSREQIHNFWGGNKDFGAFLVISL